MSAPMERWPNSLGKRRAKSGSSTISRVPAMVRIVSGAKRSRSVAEGAKLAGMGSASCVYSGFYSGADSGAGGRAGSLQDLSIRFRHHREERLGEDPHPDHHDDERRDANPFAEIKVGHVVLYFIAER